MVKLPCISASKGVTPIRERKFHLGDSATHQVRFKVKKERGALLRVAVSSKSAKKQLYSLHLTYCDIQLGDSERAGKLNTKEDLIPSNIS